MGSKGRISKELLEIILKDRKENQFYVEPFVGGANMIDKVEGNRIGSDVNLYLIELLKSMQNGFIPPYLTREEVSAIKNEKDKFEPSLVGWAGLGCSYSGKWFGGYAGITQTKIGTTRDYISEAIKNFLSQSEKVKGIEFYNLSYSDLKIPENSIIYCDPPYKGTEGYRVKFNHDDFWEWCRIQKKKGHTIFISEYNAPEDFTCVWKKTLSSSLSANGKIGGNKLSTEKLFVHKSQL